MTDLTSNVGTSNKEISLADRLSKVIWLKPFELLVRKIEIGCISVVLPDGELLQFAGKTSQSDVDAQLVLHNYRPIADFFLMGELAFAESYLRGDWSSPDLTSFFKLCLLNERAIEPGEKGSIFTSFLNRLIHLRNANSRSGSRRNIAYHYDLGNEFYEAWLDSTMTYSSALFDAKQSSLIKDGHGLDRRERMQLLEKGQKEKYRQIAQMAQLEAGEKLLEIGCGWGGFSTLAVKEFGCDVTGLTLSKEQLRFAIDRYKAEGIEAHARAELVDYRDSEGTFDKIVSIEMFEAVGCEYWPTYFKTVYDRLRPGGVAVLQVILIEEDRFELYRNKVDFIQKYIFPGGLLPSESKLKDAAVQQGLDFEDSVLFGQSYARTCQIWRDNFDEKWPDIQNLKSANGTAKDFDMRFNNLWRYYLSYCEAGFDLGSIDVGFFKFRKK